MAKETKETKETKTEKRKVIVTGTICECRRTIKTFKGKQNGEYFYLSLKNVTYGSDEDIFTIKEAFAECGKKFTPNWIEEIEKGFVNTKTKFNLPVRFEGDEYNSLEDLMADNENFYPMGASAKLSLTIKNGAVYPKALIILENGEPIDAFADFE